MNRKRLTDAAKEENAPRSHQGFDLHPGEETSYYGKDKEGTITRSVTLKRTNRDYVYDLCDAYNDSMSADAKERGARWEVMPNGELKLGYPEHFTNKLSTDLKAKTERARRDFNHRQQYPISEAAE